MISGVSFFLCPDLAFAASTSKAGSAGKSPFTAAKQIATEQMAASANRARHGRSAKKIKESMIYEQAARRLGQLIVNHPKAWVRRICKIISGQDPRARVRLLPGVSPDQPLFRVLALVRKERLELIWQVNADKLLNPSLSQQAAFEQLEEIAAQVVKFFCGD